MRKINLDVVRLIIIAVGALFIINRVDATQHHNDMLVWYRGALPDNSN